MSMNTTARRERRRRAGGKRRDGTGLRFVRGLFAALVVTVAGAAVFALLMQWLRPTTAVVRVVNQALKLLSVAAGVYVCVGRGRDGGLLWGAAVGAAYMATGLGVCLLLGGQALPLRSWLADLGMGVAAGGLVGLLLSGMERR